MKLLVFLILSISTGLVLGEKLKCFECSEKAENNKKCSVNQSRFNEAPVDTGKSWNISDFFSFDNNILESHFLNTSIFK